MSSAAPSILGDWGSTRLRLWLIAGDAVVAQREAPGLFAPGTVPAISLAAALEELDPHGEAARIVLCGMAGARGGMLEAPYRDCPAGPAEWAGAAACADFAGRELAVLPGLRCRSEAGVPDVMRGEECQVFGAIAADPALGEGTWHCVLPGTHSKWVTLRDGRITGFTTCITGEFFARLEESSLLGAARLDEHGSGSEDDGFTDGLAARQRGGAIGTLAFAARSARLCDGRSLAWARGYLSGLLIADEIGAHCPVAMDREVVVIGAPRLVARYAEALRATGTAARIADGDVCVLQGLETANAQR